MRRTLPSLATLTLLGFLTACGSDSAAVSSATSTVASSAEATTAPLASTPAAVTPSATPEIAATTKPVAKAPALTCTQLADADLGSPAAPFYGHSDHIPLLDGAWNGEDGTGVELQKPCAVGDLDGDGAADAARAVRMRTGGVGQFWSVVFWHNASGRPAYRTLVDLGDRTPVTSVSISGQQATVVWLTRSADASMAELNIRRTSVYQLSGITVTAVSHTDAPYTP